MQYSGLFDPPFMRISPTIPVRFPCPVVPSPSQIVTPVVVSVVKRMKCVDCFDIVARIAARPVADALDPVSCMRPRAVVSAEDEVMRRPLPEVRPLSVILMPTPVVSVAEVIITSCPVVAAVAAMSIMVPVVVPVSTPVEVRRSMELPAPITEVPCTRLTRVPAPKVSALLVTKMPSPAVVFTATIPSVLPVPVVDAPVSETTLPVKPVVTPDCTMPSKVAEVEEDAVPRILTTVPATCPVDVTSRMVPLVAPPVSTEVEESCTSEPPSAMTEVV